MEMKSCPMPTVTVTKDQSGVTATDKACAAKCESQCANQHGGAGNTCKTPGC